MNITTVLLATCLAIPFCGVLAAVVPFFQRRTEAFAVTVPSAAQDDPFVRSLKRRYAAIVLAATAALSAACVAAALANNPGVLFALLIIGTFGLLFTSYGLMLAYRRRVVAYKAEKGWVAQAQQAVAEVGADRADAPRGLSLKWNLLYIPVILITAAIAAAGYPSMPDQVPMHMDFDGTVSGWAEKGIGVVAFPILLEAFLAVVMVLCHWQMLISKKWKEPGSPASSAWAYDMFVRANTMVIVGGGMIIVAAMGVGLELFIVGAVSIDVAVVAMLISTVPLVVASIAVSVVYGQCGSRVFRRMQTSETMLVDDDAHWKLGIFYWAPEDASVFVPERFGFGWTINCARPAAWAILAGFALLTVAFVVACMAMVG